MQKIETTRKLLKDKIEQFKNEKASIQPLVGKITEQTKMLQNKVFSMYICHQLFVAQE